MNRKLAFNLNVAHGRHIDEFAEAMAQGEEVLRIAREVDDRSDLVYAYRSLRRGAIAQAIPAARARRGGVPSGRGAEFL